MRTPGGDCWAPLLHTMGLEVLSLCSALQEYQGMAKAAHGKDEEGPVVQRTSLPCTAPQASFPLPSKVLSVPRVCPLTQETGQRF